MMRSASQNRMSWPNCLPPITPKVLTRAGLLFLVLLAFARISVKSNTPDVLDHFVSTARSFSPRDNHTTTFLDYDRDNVKYIYPEVIDAIYERIDKDAVNWSKYAYVLYATSKAHVCNAMMIMAELDKLKSRAKRVILVRKEFLDKAHEDYDKELLALAEKYHVHLKPVEVTQLSKGSYWTSSFTKLLVFNEVEYDRVIYVDSDAMILKSMDELFFLPPAQLASTSGYWLLPDRYNNKDGTTVYDPEEYNFNPRTMEERLNNISQIVEENVDPWTNKNGLLEILQDNDFDLNNKIKEKNFYNNLYNNLPAFPFVNEFSFTSIILVIQPSTELFQRVQDSFKVRKKTDYDMDMLNFYVFKLTKSIERQQAIDPMNLDLGDIIHIDPNPTREKSLDIPDFLLIPHNVYGALTLEFNINTDHTSFLADPFDQPFIAHYRPKKDNRGVITQRSYFDISGFKDQARWFIDRVKYIHFSDSPIPKAWISQDPKNSYMSHRARCAAHYENLHDTGDVKPGRRTDDCSAGEIWEDIHKKFKTFRKEVCNLDLMENPNPWREIN